MALAQDNGCASSGPPAGWRSARLVRTGKQGGSADIVIHRPDGADETITVTEPGWLYSFEIDAAGRAIRAGQGEFARRA